MFHSHSSPIPPLAIFPPFRLQIPPWGAKWLTLRNTVLDNTSVNTGTNSGLVVVLEKILGRNLHCIGCSLHQNKLPLRAIFKKLDGETAGPKKL